MKNAYPLLPFKSPLGPQDDPYVRAISHAGTAEVSEWHPFHSGLYIFCKGHLENLILSNLGDRGEMAHSVEGRTPFLDHHLTEYANGLPPSMKIRARDGFVEKYVLREAARPYITDEIYHKRKHPYSAPLKYAVGGPLHRLIKELVTEEKVARLGFLASGSWGCLVDQAFSGNVSTFKLIIYVAQWVVLSIRFGVETAIC